MRAHPLRLPPVHSATAGAQPALSTEAVPSSAARGDAHCSQRLLPPFDRRGIIEQTLEFSKLSNEAEQGENAATAVSLVPFSVADLASELVDIAGGKSVLCGAELLVTVEPALWSAWLIGDAFRMRQCLINLVDKCAPRPDNARHAPPRPELALPKAVLGRLASLALLRAPACLAASRPGKRGRRTAIAHAAAGVPTPARRIGHHAPAHMREAVRALRREGRVLRANALRMR